MSDLVRLIPEYLMLGGALAVLFVDRSGAKRRFVTLLGAACAILALGTTLWLGTSAPMFGGLLAHDPVTVFARAAVAALTAVWLVWLSARGMGPERSSEAVALALLSALGGMLMVAARDIIVLFVSLELSTMPAYVLMGYRRADARGLEGALKYFLLSMLTSLVMLYGLSFVYGLSGSTAYAEIASGGGGLLRAIAFAFVLVGLFAKLSAAPFHYWTPDAYSGAAPAAVAFVSTVPKVAATVALTQIVAALAPGVPEARGILVAAAVVSMLIGNLAALPQTDIRRLMAYSGVAHTGYLLIAVAAGADRAGAAAFYALAYAVPSMAVMLISAEEGTSLADLGGLAARRPALAWSAIVWLLSLVGVPPMIGFFGKLYLFASALQADLVWPVLLAVAMSVVSAGYYFKLVRESFFASGSGATVPPDAGATIAFGALALIALALGAAASPILRFLELGF